MFRRILLGIIACNLCAIGLTGCARLQRLIQPTAPDDTFLVAAVLPPYSGPKARVKVADFNVQSAKATGEIGSGLRNILLDMLLESNRFSIIEPQAAKNADTQEQALSADLIITATVTEFEPQVSGGKAGIGGGGGVGSGMWGGLLGAALNKASMALDIRIVDTSTSEVLLTKRVPGQASDVSGAVMSDSLGGKLQGALSAYANAPMEKAMRICIIEALRYILQTIPANYYKY